MSRPLLARRHALMRFVSRYSHSEAQLVELITHAACVEQRAGALGAATMAAQSSGKRRRLDSSSGEPPSAALWSPLEAIEVRSRNDHEWGAVHYRQAWFLQVRVNMEQAVLT